MALEVFQCDSCPKSYNLQGELNRHQKRHSKPFRCEKCSRGFALRLDLGRHIKARHLVGNDQHRCLVDQCRKTFERKDNLTRHVRKYHPSALPSAKSNSSMADATTTDSLPQNVGISSTANSFNGIYSISMFAQAATSGNIETLERLMTFGFTPDTTAGDDSTALHCAARNGQAKTVQYLLGKGANVDAKNKSGRMPLHEAFLGSDLDTVKALIEHIPNEQNVRERWQTTERYLAQTKNIEIVDLYAQHSKTNFGHHFANRIFGNAMMAKNDTLAAALLDHPDFDVNAHNGNYAPIHDAARYGNAKIMGLLLASDKINKNCGTRHHYRLALHVAASNGHANIVEQLLNLKFDVNSQDGCRRTPLQHAVKRGHLEIIKLLMDKWKADISSSDMYGRTPLLDAAFKGDWKCVHVLLEHIVPKTHHDIMDDQSTNKEFVKDIITRFLNFAAFESRHILYSPNNLLHSAVKNRDFEALEVFLSHSDIDVNRKHYSDGSPLFMAVMRGQIEAVRLLLQHPQIDLNQKCLWGATALSWARKERQQEIVDLLLSHGAVDDQGGNAPTITTEDSSSLTTVKAGHMHNTSLQSKHEIDPRFNLDTFMGAPALDDNSDAEDEMMGQEFS